LGVQKYENLDNIIPYANKKDVKRTCIKNTRLISQHNLFRRESAVNGSTWN